MALLAGVSVLAMAAPPAVVLRRRLAVRWLSLVNHSSR